MKKFFVEKEFIQNNHVFITGEEFFHLSKVLRLNIGTQIKCFCGDEFEYICTLTEIKKTEAVATLNNKVFCIANPKVEIDLFQGLPKGEKLETIIQKISELGANKIIPFTSDFTIAKNNNVKMERLKKISKEACKQCGRSKPLEICNTITLATMEQYFSGYELVIFAYENSGIINNISKFENEIKSCKKIAIIIGAEGGFSEKEKEMLSSIKNAITISLGKRILRTETTAIALVGYVSFLLNN